MDVDLGVSYLAMMVTTMGIAEVFKGEHVRRK
jgi:hypothetical protein